MEPGLAATKHHTGATKRYTLFLLVFIVFGIAIRVFMLSSQSLWFDEGLSLIRSDGSNLWAFLRRLNSTLYDKYQPTYFLSLFVWRQWFGDSVPAMRSLSVLFGSLSILVTALATQRLYGFRHAVWTTALLSVSSLHVYYSQEVRAYSLVFLLSALEIYLFCDVLTNQTKSLPKTRFRFWLLVIFGCLSSIFIIILTVSMCLSHLIIERHIKTWFKWWLPLLVSVLPLVLTYSVVETDINFNVQFTTWYGTHVLQNLLYVISGLLAGNTYFAPAEQLRVNDKLAVLLAYWPHILVFLFALTSISTASGYQLLKTARTHIEHQTQRLDRFFILLITISLGLMMAFAMVTQINWVPRHSCYGVLAISIVIPSSFCRVNIHTWQDRGIARIAMVGTLLLIAINIYSLGNYFFNPAYARDDYRSAAEYVIHQSPTESASVLLWGSVRLLQYYGDTTTIKLDGTQIEPNALSETIQSLTNNAENVLVLINREFFLEYSVESAMADRYDLAQAIRAPYFTIYTFTQTAGTEVL